MAFLDAEGVRALGLAAVGEQVLIDEDARLIGAQRIHVGSHVRIDAFCVLSAGRDGIQIGDRVHVAAHCFVAGAARIQLGDFSNISGRTSIYSSSDDFSGLHLTGPTVPDELRGVDSRPVRVQRHALVGAGTVVLPGVTIGEGAAVGAMSLVRTDVAPFTIVAGRPAREIGSRDRRLLELERRLEG
jgi:acetyltransferase-like isoleucine patch superfamily enzyme